MTKASVNIARLFYLLICQVAGVAVALSTKDTSIEISAGTGLFIGLAIGIFFISVDRLLKSFSLRGFSSATCGLGVGLLCAWLLTQVEFSSLLELALSGEKDRASIETLRLAIDITLFSSLGFLGTVMALRSNRDDFAFIIPYVRFRQDSSSGQPIVLDAETVMDGRILGLITSGFISGRLIVPQFVLEHIQTLSEESGSGKKQRAERGLENLAKMQRTPDAQVSIHQARTSSLETTTDTQLIETAKFFSARLLTLDDGLTKMGKLQGISVLNLNDLDKALRPPLAVGQALRVALVRPGKDEHQAVGYLPDGTMIVVNHAAEEIGTAVDVVIVTMLQTAAGIMVFAEIS